MSDIAMAAAPKTLQLDDLLDEFEPRVKPVAFSASKPTPKRAKQTETVFPSREPKGPARIQLNCYIKADVAERFKVFLERDEYTTWSYGQGIEVLLDHYERNHKKSSKA